MTEVGTGAAVDDIAALLVKSTVPGRPRRRSTVATCAMSLSLSTTTTQARAGRRTYFLKVLMIFPLPSEV